MTSTTPVARAQFINGLRDLANFLGAHFGYPVPDTADILVFADGDSYAERCAVVDRLALILDVLPAADLGHYSAGRDFGRVNTASSRSPTPGASTTPSSSPSRMSGPRRGRTSITPPGPIPSTAATEEISTMHAAFVLQDSPRRDTRLIVHPGRCAQPVQLRGKVDYLDRGSGELLHRYTTAHEPGGVLRVPCKTRRASRCPSCAETYRADTYQLIRAGLTGGKGVPATVAAHPCLFVTLTAPSFGPVHARREKDGRVLACRPRRDGGTCPHGRPLGCAERHHADDPRIGEPICADCYDYTGSVLFNAVAPELWRRFTIALWRTLARLAGMTQKDLKRRVRVSFAKVAEYQRRGVVHFHAVIRIDGPDGPTTQPPSWATANLLAGAISGAAAVVQVVTPAADPIGSRVLRWGAQLDVRPVAADGELTDNAVAGYVAKYATKAAECTGTLDRRVSNAENLDELPVTRHARRLIAECFRIAQVPDLADLRTAEWAHMLGFRGHFSTKSRAYSTTLGALRAARAEYPRLEYADELPTGDTVLVVADWRFAGLGSLDDLAADDLDDTPPLLLASAIPPTCREKGEQP